MRAIHLDRAVAKLAFVLPALLAVFSIGQASAEMVFTDDFESFAGPGQTSLNTGPNYVGENGAVVKDGVGQFAGSRVLGRDITGGASSDQFAAFTNPAPFGFANDSVVELRFEGGVGNSGAQRARVGIGQDNNNNPVWNGPNTDFGMINTALQATPFAGVSFYTANNFNFNPDDRYLFRAVYDFGAASGDGIGNYFYTNLTAGGPETAVSFNELNSSTLFGLDIPLGMTSASVTASQLDMVRFRVAGTGQIDNVSVTAVPEPSSLLLLGTGVVGIAGRRKLSKAKRK